MFRTHTTAQSAALQQSHAEPDSQVSGEGYQYASFTAHASSAACAHDQCHGAEQSGLENEYAKALARAKSQLDLDLQEAFCANAESVHAADPDVASGPDPAVTRASTAVPVPWCRGDTGGGAQHREHSANISWVGGDCYDGDANDGSGKRSVQVCDTQVSKTQVYDTQVSKTQVSGSRAGTSKAPAGSAGFGLRLLSFCRHCWSEFTQPPLEIEVSVDSHAQAQSPLGCQYYAHSLNSGFLASPKVPSLQNYQLYPAVPMHMEQLSDLTTAMLPVLSAEAQRPLSKEDVFFLGFGFNWLPKHTRRLQEILEVGLTPARFGSKGSPDIHGVEDNDAFKPLYFDRRLLQGHTLLIGTTGSGKTRFFDLLVTQAIMRHETVLIIDPKGDRDLQQCILRAMRQAGRDPMVELFCLDIGRARGLDLNSKQGERYANLSSGLKYEWTLNQVNEAFPHPRNSITLPYLQQELSVSAPADFSTQSAGAAAPDCVPNCAPDGAPDGALESALKSTPERALERATVRDPDFADGSALDTQGPEQDPDKYFFSYMNTGFNPTSAFDRSTEIGDRICAMMPDTGTAATFKAYAQMAVSAAVECLMIAGKSVTLERIRSIVADHTAFVGALRLFLNRVVIKLNLPEISTFFNRIHGVTIPQLQIFNHTVSLLLGDNADTSASKKKEASLLQFLISKNVLKSTAATDKILQAADMTQGMPDVAKDDDDESTSTSTRKTTRSRAKKPRGVHPASVTEINKFYQWLIRRGYIEKHVGFDKILAIATLAPDFYRRVTNGVMPYLSALTAGDLGELMSNEAKHLPTFLDLIKQNRVFYVALQCLKDATTGQALGKLMMSDLAFVAGELNLQEPDYPQVSVFIDEASELSNESLVQLLNKSRSVKFSITLATQCMADLTKRTGSRDSAEQIIANCNNLISLRVNDPDSSRLISSVLPRTVIGMRGASIMSTENGGFINDSYITSRSLQQQDAPLFPESMLIQLPDLEFIARMSSGGFYKGFIPILDHNFRASCPSVQTTCTSISASTTTASLDAPDLPFPHPDYDPEFAQVANMMDMGFQVHPRQARLAQSSQPPVLFGSCWEQRNSHPLVHYQVEGQRLQASPTVATVVDSVGTPSNAAMALATAGPALTSEQGEPERSAPDTAPSQSLWQRVQAGVGRWGKGLGRKLVTTVFSVSVLRGLSLLLQAGLVLAIAMVLSMLAMGSQQWGVFIQSVQQLWSNLGFYCFTVLPNIVTEHYLVLPASEYGFAERLVDSLSLYWANPELLLALLLGGVLLGHHHSLMCEMRHRSVMGLRQFTHLLGWPWLVLWAITLGSLVWGFVLCVELTQLVLALAAFTAGFYLACFYSQRTR